MDPRPEPTNAPPAADNVIDSIQRSDLGHWSPRRMGVPPLFDWWPAYVVIAGAAALVVLATARALFETMVPLAHVLVIMTFAAALTFALLPLVDRMQSVIGSRSLSVLIVFAFFLIALGSLGAALVAGFAAEGDRLSDSIRQYGDGIQGKAPLLIGDRELPSSIAERIRGFMETYGPELAARSSGLVFALLGTIVDGFLVLVITVYLLLDARRFRALFLRALHPNVRPPARRVITEVGRVFGAYLRAQLVLALSIGLLITLLLSLLHVPYALLLGVFAGTAELVPMLGPIVGAVPAVLVAAGQPWPTAAWVAIGFILIQQLESNLLMPRLIGGAIGIHPIGALLALVAGFQLGGPVGALISVPITGLLWVLISTAAFAWRGKRLELARRQRQPWRPRRRRRVPLPERPASAELPR